MQRNPFEDVNLDMINEIASHLDFLSALSLKSTSKLFANNIQITPQQYNDTVKFINTVLSLLSKSSKMSMETKSFVSAGIDLSDKYEQFVYYVDKKKIDEELALRADIDVDRDLYWLLESKLSHIEYGYIISTNGCCYTCKGNKFSAPCSYILSAEEISIIDKIPKDNNLKLALNSLKRKEASVVANIFSKVYEKQWFLPALLNSKEMADIIKNRVMLCAATYLASMLSEDGRYGLNNTNNPGKLWYPHTSWKIEVQAFKKPNESFSGELFIKFLVQRLMEGKLAFSIDLIHPNLIDGDFKEEQIQKALKPLQQLLDYYNILKVEDFLKMNNSPTNTLK